MNERMQAKLELAVFHAIETHGSHGLALEEILSLFFNHSSKNVKLAISSLLQDGEIFVVYDFEKVFMDSRFVAANEVTK